ncbi:MAG: hypothetical protein CMJ18_14680 [Phycisphaeraceae bacterium]|nr:hypothetical protein [Phycisphaeraceae bacterium]
MKLKRKRWIALLIVLALMLLSFTWMRWRPAQRFESSLPRHQEFRVATWNVGYFSMTRDKNVRKTDLKPIVETIRALHADVVILQELGSLDHPETIAGELGEDWNAYAVETGHGRQVLAILSRSESRETGDCECGGRKVKTVSLKSRTGRSVFVAGVHSPHPARGPSDTVDNIRCVISRARDRTEEIRIIAGDMNYNFDPDREEDELYREIRSDFGDGTSSLGETYYAHTRIDHVFHYPESLEVVEEGSGLLDLSWRFANVPGFRDHRPIVVTYDLGQ